MQTSFIISYLLATCFCAILACDCPVKHGQEKLCDADFVGRIIVLNKTEQGNWTVYDIKYRGGPKMTKEALQAIGLHSSVKKIYTYKTDEECGVTLDIGESYVITGHVIDSKLVITKCDIYKLWKLTLTRWIEIVYMDLKNCCSCKIIPCDVILQDCKSDKDTCTWDINNKNETLYGTCMRKDDEASCQWTISKKPLHNIKYAFPLPNDKSDDSNESIDS